jgi:hypothetical protein
MKLTLCFKLLGMGAINLGTALLSQEPSLTQPKLSATTIPSNASVTVVPTIPSVPAPPMAPIIPPGGVDAPEPLTRDYFFCGKDSNGNPTTYVNTPSGSNIPLIRWVSDYFEPSNYTSEARCQDVSQRFNRFYRQGTLNFVTSGFINDQPVVCVADRRNGPCTATLFTLKSGQNATQTIQQLFDVRVGNAGPLLESEKRIYVDMKSYIDANR